MLMSMDALLPVQNCGYSCLNFLNPPGKRKYIFMLNIHLLVGPLGLLGYFLGTNLASICKKVGLVHFGFDCAFERFSF